MCAVLHIACEITPTSFDNYGNFQAKCALWKYPIFYFSFCKKTVCKRSGHILTKFVTMSTLQSHFFSLSFPISHLHRCKVTFIRFHDESFASSLRFISDIRTVCKAMLSDFCKTWLQYHNRSL